MTPLTIERAALDELFAALMARGYTPVGPLVRDRAIVYDELDSSADLPVGWTDVQEGGSYRLERRDDEALFGYNVGPHSWKRFLFPPTLRLWRARRDATAGSRSTRSARRRRATRSSACARATCTRSRVQDRVFIERRLRRSRLPGAARGRVHRRRQLRPGGRHVLLRLDGDRPARDRRASTSR